MGIHINSSKIVEDNEKYINLINSVKRNYSNSLLIVYIDAN